MQNSAFMGELHRARHFRDQFHAGARLVTKCARRLSQTPARSELHAEEGQAIRALAHLVDGQNIGMVETRRRFCFAAKPLQCFARIGVIPEHAFDRDDAA